MQVLERLSLGEKRTLLLVQVDEETLLLGATPQNVSLLSSLKTAVADGSEGAEEDAPVRTATRVRFRDVLEMIR